MTSTAVDIADIYYKDWHCRGIPLPHSIVTDHDSRFLSDFWKSLMTSLGIRHILPTARHQQTNGLAEKIVQLVKNALRKLVTRTSRLESLLPAIALA